MDDLDALLERLVTSIAATLGPLLAPYAGEQVYAVALLTDSDVTTVGLTAHSEEALARLVAALPGEDRDDPGMRTHLRWWPDEWGDGDLGVVPEGGAEPLARVSDALARAADAAPDHARWRSTGRTLLDAALGDARVRARHAEVAPGSAPVLLVTDTDGAAGPTVASLDALDRDHPEPALVAAARAYFSA
ncbi:DUF4303 domain-containing protein [Nocardioides sp. CPCC 205120]|uniref:DUF4303 domain-containing protein n=1 Tax=Nocardioides sp. CPCC 205120 TaxID=3406462 RepID=UPI003B514CB5